MTRRKAKLKPIKKDKAESREFARQVREINDRLKAEGRTFPDSTGIIRAGRDSRV